MKILVISQYFWPENFRINELCSELVKTNNTVTVLTGLPNYPEGEIYKEFNKNKNNFFKYKNVDIKRVPIIPRKKGKFNLLINYLSFSINASILGLIKIFKDDYDLIFVFQTSPVLVGIPSTIISLIKRIPQVFWVLDIWPETLLSVGIKNKLVIKLTKFLVHLIYLNCDLILTQSKSFENNIKKYRGIKNKTLYFPAWSEFNLKSKNHKKASIIQEKNIFTLMFAGNIGEAQDFPSIIRSIEILSKRGIRNFRFIVVGEGSKKDWLIKEINEKKLNNLVEIYQKFPLEKMPSIFSHADALLVSLSDKIAFNMTIPGKIQTYLSTGIPILGMLNGEGANLIKEARAGFACNAGDFKGLAGLISKFIYSEKNTLNELGLNGIKYSQEEFDKKRLIIKLNNIFKCVLDDTKK